MNEGGFEDRNGNHVKPGDRVMYILGGHVLGRGVLREALQDGDGDAYVDFDNHISSDCKWTNLYKDLSVPIAKSTSTINHPPHYGGGDNPYEAIKVIEAWGLGFCLGNAVKYISRAGKKNERLEDLKKARWYLDREIAKLEDDVND